MFLSTKPKVKDNGSPNPKHAFVISEPIKMRATKQEGEPFIDIDFSKLKI